MQITYRQVSHPALEIFTANIKLQYFGRETDMSVSVYKSADNRFAISFGTRPSVENQLSFSLVNGLFRITEKHRILEQKIEVPTCHGFICNYSQMNGDNELGRYIADLFLRKFESIFETHKQWMLKNLSSVTKDLVVQKINNIYGQQFIENCNILKQINWKFLFQRFNDECSGVINFILSNNNFAFNTLNNSQHKIPILKFQFLNDGIDLPGIKAENLLAQVIGEDRATEFKHTGSVQFISQGYTFKLAKNRWVECKDAKGHKARLCIHTIGLSCHPLDELTIAYMYLNNPVTFKEFMNTAIYYDKDEGFLKP